MSLIILILSDECVCNNFPCLKIFLCVLKKNKIDTIPKKTNIANDTIGLAKKSKKQMAKKSKISRHKLIMFKTKTDVFPTSNVKLLIIIEEFFSISLR